MTTQPAVSRPARRLSIFLEHRDRVHQRPVLLEVLRRARRAKLSGATVVRAEVGYGASGRLHRPHALSEDSPHAVVIVEAPERIEAFLAAVSDLLTDVVVVDEVEIVAT